MCCGIKVKNESGGLRYLSSPDFLYPYLYNFPPQKIKVPDRNRIYLLLPQYLEH